MAGDRPPSLNPAALPLGTVVGAWRVVDYCGCGTHGAVYRAVHVDKEHSPPIALKLALRPRNPRFAHEAELLSRIRSPSVPRLWEAGEWRHPRGDFFPYLAMEWIEGVSLYTWARQHPPSSRQVLRLLAQLARALQAVHSHGSLHRDLKGDNVLMRSSDGRAMLIDFGSGLYPGAPTLTPPDFYPGTPAYRSPESGLFELNSLRERSARYRAGPADDLYALGVTACRLLTGEYPELPEPTQDEHGTWRMEAVKTPAALLQAEPPLRELVLRMLSVQPEARGSVEQLAEQLERAAEFLAPTCPSPAANLGSATRARTRWPRLALGASALMLLMGLGWALVHQLGGLSSGAQVLDARGGQADGGTAGLGEAASATSTAEAAQPSHQQVMAEESLPEPLPGQLRPDAKGRCPHKGQVALNEACWVPLNFAREQCEAFGSIGKLFKGRCYVPAMPLSPKHPATSHPPREP
jgi:eukaryotic-like serine/threonine-protein kinase